MIAPRFSAALPLVFLALCLGACGNGRNAAPPALPAVPVTTAAPALETVRDAMAFDGTVAPSAAANVVARVAGVLEAAPFKEGDAVKKGQVLFRIEPAPYREQVKLNEAKLEQAQAEAARQAALLAENATSQASAENARSQLQQAEANLQLARINFGYTEVRAPFDGIVGRRLVDVGNYVGATPGGTVLGTVLQLRPAYVNFAVNERDLLRLRDKVGKPRAGVGKVPVSASLQGESAPSSEGVLDFIDNALGASSGSIQVRASFANADLHLLPGLYARVAIDVGASRQALLVPASAVLTDQQGSYVFVVGADQVAKRRDIETGAQFGARREVLKGLEASDAVVINGVANIRDGQGVAPQAAAR